MAPTIFDRSESGLVSANPYVFGELGEPYAVTVHHSAGPRAPNKARCQELNRSYQDFHVGKGWGDIGYHACMDDLGRFYRLRPHDAKGAHVGGWNTGNLGLMIHGNYMVHDLTERQRDSIEWLFKGGFYALFDVSEYDLRFARSHREWTNHTTNQCPGDNLQKHWAWRRSQDFRTAKGE
jgi:hypothetical protein